MKIERTYTRMIEPLALGWRSATWPGGSFDTGRRPHTENVEGVICTPDHMVLVTLRGQAKHLEVTTDCGHRYIGSDRAGAVSFVPAHCGRRLALKGVCSEWASIALCPESLEDAMKGGSLDFAPFSNVDDPFIAGLVGEFERLLTLDGRLDPAYCETMSLGLGCYLSRRYGAGNSISEKRPWKLSPRSIRRMTDYIEAHLDAPILIRDLAALVGVSAGHLHRAFRVTVGTTPLDYIHERRIQRAMRMLASENGSIAAIALRVGFLSTSHFTRTFRRIAGLNPSQFRARALI